MAWPEKIFENWGHFLAIRDGLPTPIPNRSNYVFRGQANASWPLTPSLTRMLRDVDAAISASKAEEIEIAMLNEFARAARDHFAQDVLASRTNPAARWSLMQHYGIPTRMLDWTDDILTAAYFAVESEWDKNGAIWMVHVADLNDAARKQLHGKPVSYQHFRSPQALPVVQLWMEDEPHERVRKQKGLFTFCHQILGEQEKLIEEVCRPKFERSEAYEVFRKAIIPMELKPRFMAELRARNISAKELFPGEDGYGKSLRELGRSMAWHRSGESTPSA